MKLHHMYITVLIVLAGTAASCAPSQHDPSRYGQVRVQLDTAWDATQAAELRAALADLSALGPEFVETTFGAGIYLRPMPVGALCSDGALSFHPPDVGSDHWIAGSPEVRLNDRCLRAPGALRAATVHAVFHALAWPLGFSGHVCETVGQRADCHPTLTGPSVIFPVQRVATTREADPLGGVSIEVFETFPDEGRDPHPSSADLELYRKLVGR